MTQDFTNGDVSRDFTAMPPSQMESTSNDSSMEELPDHGGQKKPDAAATEVPDRAHGVVRVFEIVMSWMLGLMVIAGGMISIGMAFMAGTAQGDDLPIIAWIVPALMGTAFLCAGIYIIANVTFGVGKLKVRIRVGGSSGRH